MDDSASIEYYRKRAAKPDDGYGPAEMHEDFAWLAKWLQKGVENSRVIEVACGSGHWTKIAAVTAARVLATDIHWNLLLDARKQVTDPRVDFTTADAWQLPIPPATFDCGMAHFWLSHVPRPDIRSFVDSFARCLKPRSRLLFIDSKWVEGYRKPIVRRDPYGNTYQQRTLKDGSQYEIMKNYLTPAELTDSLQSFGVVRVEELQYVWGVSVQLGN
jgi:demethylmenaquinone methyltransferase/2-methoxy-6-polyprenyl-1,4-benzoquinol methylase